MLATYISSAMTACKNALKRLASHLQPGPKDVVAIRRETEMESSKVHSDNETGVLLRNGGGLGTNGGRHESSEDERDGGGIRVGRDYQAVPPPYISYSERQPEQCDEKALLIWSPTPTYLEECSVDAFL